MPSGKFVSYLRVSTAAQGEKGLGVEAQRTAVAAYLNGGDWKLVKEVVEVESGKRNDRPALDAALQLCRLHNATLIVGKLDRLARNARFLLKIVEESGTRGVIFCDLPHIPEGPAGKMIVTIMASVAEWEGATISQRTKAGLAEAKARGQALGGRRMSAEKFAALGAAARPLGRAVRTEKANKARAEIMPTIRDIQGNGTTSLRSVAAELNKRQIPAPRGGQWSGLQVQRVVVASSLPA